MLAISKTLQLDSENYEAQKRKYEARIAIFRIFAAKSPLQRHPAPLYKSARMRHSQIGALTAGLSKLMATQVRFLNVG